MAVACTSLTQLGAEIEERFVACGAALQQQVKLTAQLGVQGKRLHDFDAQIATGNAAICQINHLVANQLKLTDELAKEVDRLADSLNGHSCSLDQLLRDQAMVERSFAPLQVLHALVRIESVALPPELQSEFHAVTADMRRLHDDISISFESHTTAITEIRRHVLRSAEKLRQECKQHTETTTRIRNHLRKIVRRLDTELVRLRGRNQRLETAIVDLNRHTDAITVSLQYQDITRQKMEHVHANAGDILKKDANGGEEPIQRRARMQQLLCELQVAQLGSVEQELQRAGQIIMSGLTALSDSLQSIQTQCLSVGNLEQVTEEMNAVTAEMIDAQRTSGEAMRTSFASLTGAIELARGFATTTTGASHTIRRLALDLHLMGINAQVQAIRANNGSLAVLASKASAIAGETGALTVALEEKLITITAATAAFVRNSESSVENLRIQYSDLEARSQIICREIPVENDAYGATVRDVRALLQQLDHQTTRLLSSVTLADVPRGPLEDARTVFAALGAAYGSVADDRAVEQHEVLAEIENRYTMNSERAAHAATVAGRPSSQPDEASANKPLAGANADLSATTTLGDNVELF